MRVLYTVSWINIYNLLYAGDVWFKLNNTTYQNNSLVTLKNIGITNNDSLLCVTNPKKNYCSGTPLGNWFFPNGTRVPSKVVNGTWDLYRTRGHMVVRMHRKGDGEDGIYRCVIPDSMSITQTIYIGVYTASTGEWQCLYAPALFNYSITYVA